MRGRTGAALLGIAGFVLFAALILAAGRHFGVAIDDRPGEASGERGAPPPAVDAKEPPAGPTVPTRVRPVAPDVVALPELAPEELVRAEPRDPLGELGLAGPRRPGPPAGRLVHQPLAEAAGRFSAQGHVIELAGIEVIEAEEICQGTDGPWPCGMIARTAFRNFLRGRSPSCVVSDIPASETVQTRCDLGGRDLAQWLVEQGLARAEPDGPYAQAGAAAQRERRGMFGDDPRPPQ